MYDHQNQTTETAACFDPNNTPEQPATTAILTSNHNEIGFFSHVTKTTPSIVLLQESDFHNPNFGNHFHHDPNTTTPPSWDPTSTNDNITTHNSDLELGFTQFVENIQHHHPTPDFLTLLHLPTMCSFASSSSTTTTSFSFGKPTPDSGSAFGFLGEFNPSMMVDYGSGSGSGPSYDPNLFHLNLSPHQSSPLLRDLMFQHQSFPHEYNTPESGNGTDGVYNEGDTQFQGNGVFELINKGNGKGKGKGSKCPKNSVTEKQRRRNFNDKYDTLSKLIPNQTKIDRASIVLDAINHIKELKRTVGELKILVEKKRIAKERLKRHKTNDEDTEAHYDTDGLNGGGVASVKPEPDDNNFNGSIAAPLRSSWIQRKWKDTEVDVRIVDDDVTVKLVQRKKINCLLSVSRTHDELQLELCHVAGGQVGDYYSYLFNSKISEGSSVYASAIANKLIEVVEREYGAAPVVAVAPTSSF